MDETVFLTLGSQKFQFNRLLEYVDDLIDEEVLMGDVFAQTGASNYVPRNFKFEPYLDRKAFLNYMKKSSVIITHAGTGAIINAKRNNKQVIAVPRQKKYGEHVDDHQFEISNLFAQMGYIEVANTKNELKAALNTVSKVPQEQFVSNTERYIQFLSNEIGEKSEFGKKKR